MSENIRGVREYEGSQRISEESENFCRKWREYEGSQRISGESGNNMRVREYQEVRENQESQGI